MADRTDLTPFLLLGGVAVVGYVLYQNGTLAQWFPSVFGTALPSTGGTTTTQPTAAAPAAPAGSGVTTQQTGTGQPPGAQPTGAPGLTAADAATFPYSGAVTAAQMTSISQTLTPQLDAGQIPLIGGNSVLAYMLGWGNQPSGAIEQIPGTNYSYQFTGSSWILVQPSASSTAGTSSSKQVLSYALNLWANANNYPSQMNMSQWNYILNVVVPGGAPPVMTDPYQGGVMTAAQYVQALLADPTYTNNVAAIAANFGMSGFGRGNFYGRHARVPVSMIHARSGLKVYRGGR